MRATDPRLLGFGLDTNAVPLPRGAHATSMAKDKGRKDKDKGKGADDDDDDDEDDSPSSRIDRSSLDQIFSSSNWRRSVENTVHELQRKNDRLLRKNRELRERVTTLEESEPEDGGLVLSKDDAAAFDAFKKLNLKADDITKSLKELEDLRAKETERSTEEHLAEAAEALGFENVALFTRMLKREGLHLEFKDERKKNDETGKTEVTRTPMVRLAKDDKAALEPLNDYLEREMPEIVPVLQAEPVAGGSEDDEDGELAGAGVGGSTSDRSTRRTITAERNGSSGVSIPVTRGVRPSTGAAREDRRLDERLEQKRAAGGYRL